MTKRLHEGATVPVARIEDVRGTQIDLRQGELPTHLQFRRFAGCPVCSVHLQEFVRRREDVDRVMREVILFHSAASDLVTHVSHLPFAAVADPDKTIYRAFGVEAGPAALLDPRGWPAIARSILVILFAVLRGEQSMPPFSPPGGRNGLPADFMIAPDGTIMACQYGQHVDDSWSVDEAMFHAKRVVARRSALGRR